MTEKGEKAETKIEATIESQNIEKDEEEKRILKAINDKAGNNLTLKLRLLALYNYSVIESEQTDRMAIDIDLVDVKYKQLAAPLIERSNDVVNGKPLFNLDLYNYERYLTPVEASKKEDLFAKEPKTIPDYWYKALKNHSTLGKRIKPQDIEPLKALRIIEYLPSNNIEKPYDFVLKFQFVPNQYFENAELVIRFYMIDENEASKTECNNVNWKPGKDITRMEIKKTQKNKTTGASRTVQEVVDRYGFFSFFRTVDNQKVIEDDEEGDVLERQVDIAYAIVEELLPYSNEYYLGIRKEAKAKLSKNLAAIDEIENDDDMKVSKGKK